MTKATQYLEAAKVEELASTLRQQGYVVTVPPDDRDLGYDLVAKRGDKKIAIQVKERSTLAESASEIAKLRDQARQKGFDEFRLVVVAPPKKTQVDVDGLDELLTGYVINNVPDELAVLSSRTLIEGVSDHEVDSISVMKNGIRIVGSGSIDVQLEYGGGEERDGVTTSDSFPFTFDVTVDHELRHIDEERSHVQVDVSSFYDD